ncbi:hypothetical protein Lfu02_17560 [Longispora fulva]|uniref:Uncharacterized protein n=1 Tax=Longispora fulva TaxID=619741 RepID=A0A8J7KZ55_9ACTN|nr:hypothetical protein [Longispora fulva]MBG6140237.1 hypothetical protein [Longispora fulva]GIG57384.1 hypothetical protein Lfu02_17560 [Longispora fulva]
MTPGFVIHGRALDRAASLNHHSAHGLTWAEYCQTYYGIGPDEAEELISAAAAWDYLVQTPRTLASLARELWRSISNGEQP